MPLPGDPEGLVAASEGIAVGAGTLRDGGTAVAARGRSVTAAWSGTAAPLARARIVQDAADLDRVADVAARIAVPLATYAEELRAAQRDHARAEEMQAAARATPAPVLVVDVAEPGAADDADEATALMRAAEERALVANETAARAIEAAAADLPATTPRAPMTVAPAASPALAAAAIPGFEETAAHVGNAVASVGNAALNNPVDALAVVAGGTLMAASAAGVLGGGALTLTGGGAVVGAPLISASTAGMAAGGAIAGTGLIGLLTQAAGPDRIEPFRVDADSAAPDGDRARERYERTGVPGRSKHVRVVPTEREVREAYEEMSKGGVVDTPESYQGERKVLPDGTTVGLREKASSARGPTVDIVFPDRTERKVHVDGEK